MPGIAGILSNVSQLRSQSLVETMLETMRHEPCYENGLCIVEEVGICAGWLAHPGSFAARHSGFHQNGDIALVFSGECFSSTSPEGPLGNDRRGSWLVDAYLSEGEAFIARLNGLFSGLLVDRAQRRALLFNDRYGIERLYYHETSDAVYFASEAKALLKILPATRALDQHGVAQWLAYGCTRDWQTLFKGVALAPGASQWTLIPGKIGRKSRYFSPAEWESQSTLPAREFDEAFIDTFQRIVPLYFGDGKDIGISLTGGLDSRMIMAGLPRLAAKPTCYTFSAGHAKFLDARLAARVAAQCGLEHHEVTIGSDFLADYHRHLQRTVYVTDGCAGALGAHEIHLNASAKKYGSIRVTGNFGSEILRAVSTFKLQKLHPSLLLPEWQKLTAEVSSVARHPLAHPVTFSAFQEVPWRLFGTLSAARSQVSFRTPYLDNDLVALAYRVPLDYRTSSLPALRMIHRGNPALARLPTDRGLIYRNRGPSHAARRIFAEVTFKLDYMHKEGLPASLAPLAPLLGALDNIGLLGLHKFLGYRRWFQRELYDQSVSVIKESQARLANYIDTTMIDRLVSEHRKGSHNRLAEIDTILSLAHIHDMTTLRFS